MNFYKEKIHNILVIVKSKEEFENNREKYVKFVEEKCKDAVNYR